MEIAILEGIEQKTGEQAENAIYPRGMALWDFTMSSPYPRPLAEAGFGGYCKSSYKVKARRLLLVDQDGNEIIIDAPQALVKKRGR